MDARSTMSFYLWADKGRSNFPSFLLQIPTISLQFHPNLDKIALKIQSLVNILCILRESSWVKQGGNYDFLDLFFFKT